MKNGLIFFDCSVDGDGEVTVLDATAIQRCLAGLSANENIGKPII